MFYLLDENVARANLDEHEQKSRHFHQRNRRTLSQQNCSQIPMQQSALTLDEHKRIKNGDQKNDGVHNKFQHREYVRGVNSQLWRWQRGIVVGQKC